MQDFRRFEAWQVAYQGTLALYRLTDSFPMDERFGLTSQLRRAAVSVISNISEGAGRRSQAELARYLDMARSSCAELECQLMLAQDLGYANRSELNLVEETFARVRKMLTSLAERVRKQT